MVLTHETRYVYPFHWDVVTRAFWNKYPNERLAHVERVDVLDRQLDAQGRLVTTRLAKVTQTNVPQWVRSALNDEHKTLYEAEAKVTAFVPLVGRKLESFSASRGADTAAKGIRVVEEICNDIFQGTFQPAFCEAMRGAATASVAAHTTREMVIAGTQDADKP
ncbi:unnamed protein product [Hyaloperonospora brassicae]|uniref:PRELI/MSF1 domain-containing protein n=1 Tax=Hyaloperonospora brassicae TaxID=162125 RepID=A0AAV0U609_HYABA|nr:unnamed protein product [Hyaloperonospora brassicae]